MSTYTSKVDICQGAAMLVGTESISSIENPKTVTESRLSFLYDKVRVSVLRQGVWNFATKVFTLSKLVGEDLPDGMAAAYSFPTDFIRYMGLFLNGEMYVQDTSDYLISNGKLYQRYYDSDSLSIIYIRNIQDVSKFDPLFSDALVLKLASELAFVETGRTTLVSQLREEYELALVAAKAVDGQEQKPKRITRSKWLTARRLGLRSSAATPYEEI